MEAPQFQRLAERDRPVIRFAIDGRACEALAGDTLLTALLTNGRRLRSSEFGDGQRAGFCLMGACQDCWVALDDGTRLRACTSFVVEGMRVVTRSDVGTSANDLAPEGRRAVPRVPNDER
jgi:aerobic-type carbon monoxide dehydrogenase small subunit (CoxS/CutS family)